MTPQILDDLSVGVVVNAKADFRRTSATAAGSIEVMDNILNNKLDGKAAFITGGSRGIGAAVALRLAAEGADVGFTYLNDDDSSASVVEAIKEHGRRGLAFRVDSADAEAVIEAMNSATATFGRLDVLVNNAALYPMGPVTETGLDDFDQTIAVNVRTPFAVSAAA
ncbi:SDR family NAD(P)-dependent oxidoreductase, partial [Phytoactinopolyspora endophytica]|uniref:SDR family NAD(P)-dependent oxidoreductase n=1 Tax=Phytoactinopolyspora endophytica TaxID=1642495 RepID=UPI001F109594